MRHGTIWAACAAVTLAGAAWGYSDSYLTCDDESVRCIAFKDLRRVYVFTNTAAAATVTANQAITVERLLVVGGGGAGGGHIAGGGGGGGVIYSEDPFLIGSGANFSVCVGAGGVGTSGARGGQGGTSYFDLSDGNPVYAYGGGGGGCENSGAPTSVSDGKIGSAGGGQGFTGYVDGTHYNSAQGNRGGQNGSGRNTSGGGGACAHGVDSSQNGGEGLACNIAGVHEVYGSGGGGGGGWDGYGLKTYGVGGTHAGRGGIYNAYGGVAGDPCFGGGGGGSARSAAGAAGGSGTVILQVASGDTTAATRIGFAKPKDQYLVGSSVTLDLVVTNASTGTTLDPSTYTISYADNDKAGTAHVFVTTQDGGFWQQDFTIYPCGYYDDNLYVTDDSVQRKSVGKRFAYVFTNTADATRLEFRRTATIEKYLVLGGGGAGGKHLGGGGGGGGLIYAEEDLCSVGLDDVTWLSVGAGGVGSTASVTVPGGASTLTLPGRTVITAYGGGGGGTYDGGAKNPSTGKLGSGGGGSDSGSGKTDGTYYTSSQGNYGGAAVNCRSGGGGGAGEPGEDGVSSGAAGNGGEGRTLKITGEDVVYASGGGGGGGHGGYGGQPGLGGTNAGDGEAFNGGWTGKRTAVAGTGAGGGGGSNSHGGDGACGTVILLIYPGDSTALQFAIDAIPDGLWYGTPVTPTVTVRRVSDPTVVLSPGTDYTVAYANNNAAGTCTVTATGVEGSDYEGLIARTTFNLTRAYQFSVAAVAQKLYVGSPITPKPAVTNAILGVTPAEGTDFDYSYLDNDAVGTAKVIATGLGNYAGWAVTNAFTIMPTYSDDANFYVSDPDFGVTTLGKRKVYVFTNLTENALHAKRLLTVEKILVVAGGGGGGGTMGAGGGAGGLLYVDDAFLISSGSDLSVTVGGGGAGASDRGTSGGNSSFVSDARTLVAVGGGGGGGYYTHNGLSGGSGGGGSQSGGAGGAGTDGQGYAGGSSSAAHTGGGGGGAGGSGKSGTNGRDGGSGFTCDITGESLEYARGGKGCGLNLGITYEPAGENGRGDGGGGGGQQSGTNYSGTKGGSGVVILYVAERDTVNYRFGIAVPPTQYWYGEDVHPEPVVSNLVTGAVLTNGVHFTYSYENCDTPGRGRVIATGVDDSDYDGCYAFAEFDIIDTFKFAIAPIPRQPFLGEAVCPTLVVTNSVVGGELEKDVHYTVSYEDNQAVGTAKAIATGKTGTHYAGFAATNSFEIAETYVDDYVYTTDPSVRRIVDGTRKIYVFTNTADTFTFNFRTNMTMTECLIVGGGGGGGGTMGAGGGAGGYVVSSNKIILTSQNNITVKVGAGGAGAQYAGANGAASTFSVDGLATTALGGGGGGGGSSSASVICGRDGGSGGGSYQNGSAGKGTEGQGHDGGVSGTQNYGGGGGGAGGAGQSHANGRWGGVGVTNSITGTAIEYARGGRGSGYNISADTESAGTDGLGYGGSGGGQRSGTNYSGYRGGSGTVILALKEGGVLGQPEFGPDGIVVTFPHGDSVPVATVLLAGDADASYVAAAEFEFGVEEGAYTVSQTVSGLQRGDTATVSPDLAPAKGATLYVRVTLTATGANTRMQTTSVAVPYDPPPWFGRGGGAHVVHVRAGAYGDGSGSDWMNAMTDVRAAIAALSSAKTEVWIAGDWTLDSVCAKTTLAAASAIRGGFVGTENEASARPVGARSVLNASDAYDILQVVGNYLLTLDSIVFTHAQYRAVERTGGSLAVTNCVFDSNGRTVEQCSARALYASGGSGLTATFRDTTFALNTEKGTYAEGGACIVLSTFARATFDNCTFATNGITPNTNSGTGGYGEGGNCKGATLNVSGVPLTMRDCRFLGNKSACRGSTKSGGTIRLFDASYPSAFTNCLFVGNSERQPQSGSGEFSSYAGALVVDLNSAAGAVDVDGCDFAWNLADCTESPAGIHVLKGALKVRNSIFWGNKRRDTDKAGVDIDVNAGSTADVDYSLFAEDSTNCVSYADGTLAFGAHNVFGNPKFVTSDEDLAGIVLTNKSTFNFIYFDWNRLDELVRFNAHVRDRLGYLDEKTGAKVYWRGSKSPAVDAGDPARDCSREPWPNGRRRNLGLYGNTPYAVPSPAGNAMTVR